MVQQFTMKGASPQAMYRETLVITGQISVTAALKSTEILINILPL